MLSTLIIATFLIGFFEFFDRNLRMLQGLPRKIFAECSFVLSLLKYAVGKTGDGFLSWLCWDREPSPVLPDGDVTGTT